MSAAPDIAVAPVTAADVLRTLRWAKRHPIVREVSIRDPHVEAIYRRYQLDIWPDIYGSRFEGLEVADSVPEGFDFAKFERRIDALMLASDGKRTAIEIKISRGDFFRDTEEKRRAWREVTHNFVYATPPGLVRPDEVPAGCGLWEVSTTAKYVSQAVASVVRPKRNREVRPLPDQVWRTMFGRVSRYESEREGVAESEAHR